MAKAIDQGDWIPVINKHPRKYSNQIGGEELIMLFIDNLPEEVDHVWLKKNFSKFGIVRDVFIPRNRSIKSGNKFGFVRYECSFATNTAVEKTNRSWCFNKQLG